MSRHGDADLGNMLQTSVPPADLSRIDMFKAHLSKYQQKAGEFWDNDYESQSIVKLNPISCLDVAQVDDEKINKAAEPRGINA